MTKRLSLWPLKPEEAISALFQIKPKPASKKQAKKKRKKSGR